MVNSEHRVAAGACIEHPNLAVVAAGQHSGGGDRRHGSGSHIVLDKPLYYH